MAFDRAAPPALRWVAAFLALCAALGLWLGFKDQMRRNPPAWYTGASEPTAAPGSPGAEARDAVAFDPNAPARPLGVQPAADTAEKAEAKAEEKTDDADAAADAPLTETKPLDVPAPPKPKAAPTPAPKPSEDPVGDILDSQQQKPAETPPTVPY